MLGETGLEKRRNSLRHIFARYFTREEKSTLHENTIFLHTKTNSRFSIINQRVILIHKSTCFLLLLLLSIQKKKIAIRCSSLESRWEKEKKKKKVHKRARAHTHKHTRDTPLNTTSNTLFSLQRNDDVWATVSPITRRTLCDRVFRV